MSFHPGKCTTLPVTRKRKPLESTYHLHGQTLRTVTSAKYLGVTLQQDLSWEPHIRNICAKANQTLGFLRRNLRIGATKVKEASYKAYVRPILEYACTVWDPSTDTQMKILEAVQRRAARFVVNRYHNTSSVDAMINRLEWPSLHQRRKTCRLAMMYKILHDQVQFDKTKIQPAPTRQRRKHHQQLSQIQCRTDYRKAAFLPKTIREWSNLSKEAVAASTLDTFVSRAH